MMKRGVYCLIAGAALALPASIGAAQSTIPGLDDPRLTKAIMEALDRPEPRYCEELAPLWAEAVKRARAPADAIALEAANAAMLCAIDEKRYEDASSLIVRTEAKYGPQSFFDNMALALHAHLQELDLAVARVESIARQDEGQLLANTSAEMLFRLSGNLARAKRDDLRSRMWSTILASPAFPDLDPDLRGGAAINLLGVKANSGTLTADDGKLVDLLSNTSAYATMLAERRYAPIWPYMEERAGDGLSRVIAADLKLNTERYEADPEDGERLSDLGYSLLQAGEIGKLIDLTARFNATDADYSGLDEASTWAVNYMAIALRAEGRAAEGLSALDRLASLDPSRFPWVVNYVINHGTSLGFDGQHEAALRAMDRAQPVAEKYGSPYARALIAGQRACSLHTLGRASEAAQQLALLEQMRADAPTAVLRFAMCADRDDLAIAWSLAALANESSRGAAISELQPAYMNDSATTVTDDQPHFLLAKSAELTAEFAKYARVVPEKFAPLGGRVKIFPQGGKDAPAAK